MAERIPTCYEVSYIPEVLCCINNRSTKLIGLKEESRHSRSQIRNWAGSKVKKRWIKYWDNYLPAAWGYEWLRRVDELNGGAISLPPRSVDLIESWIEAPNNPSAIALLSGHGISEREDLSDLSLAASRITDCDLVGAEEIRKWVWSSGLQDRREGVHVGHLARTPWVISSDGCNFIWRL